MKPTCWKVTFENRFGKQQINYECFGCLMTAKKLLDHYELRYDTKSVTVEKITEEEYRRGAEA